MELSIVLEWFVYGEPVGPGYIELVGCIDGGGIWELYAGCVGCCCSVELARWDLSANPMTI